MAARTLSRICLQSSLTAPAARAFLQLASPSRPLHRPVLDFLLPRIPSQPADPVIPQRATITMTARRAFSHTSTLQETVAIHNPRQDDDGRDMSVEITPRASNRLREIMAKDANPNLALRITVESGGCHGFQYLMSLTTLPSLPPLSESPSPTASPPSASIPQEKIAGVDEDDDTVFKALDGSDAKVVMDGPSLELLKGSKIDYTMELIGSQFKIVDNPLATSSCGCGTSFDIKA